MTRLDIKNKIDENNARIEQIINLHQFVLNPEITELMHENDELQKLCTHEFKENGYCKYCYAEKK